MARAKKSKNKTHQRKNIIRTNRCCNPFGRKRHSRRGLRKITDQMRKEYPHLSNYARICGKCRKYNPNSSSSSSTHSTSSRENFSENSLHEIENIITQANETDVPCPSVDSNKIDLKENYPNNSVKSDREKDLEEMLEGLKNLYGNLSEKDPLRTRILTIAPKSWSINKISLEFGASKRQARNAKKLLERSGVLGETNIKAKRSLSLEIVKAVKDFYEHDDNSRIMPGKKDCKTMLVGNKKMSVQKRLLLLDVRELFCSFKQVHPNKKVGFSTFCKLRPKNVILTGASGTHAVCVCTKHENAKMMLDAINIQTLTKDWETPIKDYKDCLKSITCENPSKECHFNDCCNCPDVNNFCNKICNALEEASVTHVEYAHWTSTDRATLLTIRKPTEDFIDDLSESLRLLKSHSYIAKSQSEFIKKKKRKSKKS